MKQNKIAPEDKFIMPIQMELSDDQAAAIEKICKQHKESGQTGPDIFRWTDPRIVRATFLSDSGQIVPGEDGAPLQNLEARRLHNLSTTLFEIQNGIACIIADKLFVFRGAQVADLRASVEQRNEKYGIPFEFDPDALDEPDYNPDSPRVELRLNVLQIEKIESPEPSTVNIQNFAMHTSQEVDTLFRSGSNGKAGVGWRNELQRDVRVFEMPGASHRVEIPRRVNDAAELLTWNAMERFTDTMDRDFAIVTDYVFAAIAPTQALPENRTAGAWIDLNHVMDKIGWLAAKPDKATQEELRARLYEFLLYGERAVVIGQRSTLYSHPITKEIVPTYIESAPWRITDKRRPLQDALPYTLPPGQQSAPVQVYLTISKEWERLLITPHLAQYLPLGELLGAIPPNKVGGDWARSIGLCLGREWRIKPQETIAGKFTPTRHKLLTHYAPKTKSVDEILSSRNPKRAIEYYCEALSILADGGLIARAGDAAAKMTPDKMLASYERQGWAKKWLEGDSGLSPGEKWAPDIKDRCDALPALRPKDLKLVQKRRQAFKKSAQ
jgi:hypothetical protein